jgi:hypothetical protein
MRYMNLNSLIRSLVFLTIIILGLGVFNGYGYNYDRLRVISFDRYDYTIDYNGVNYIVILATKYSIDTLGYYQLENITKNAINSIDSDGSIKRKELSPLKRYIVDVIEDMGLKPHKIYIYGDKDPPTILISMYIKNDSIIDELWTRIQKEVNNYDALIVIKKTLTPPEYIDKVKYYGEKVIKEIGNLTKANIEVQWVGFGYSYYDAVIVGFRMNYSETPSRDRVEYIVKKIREIVDDPNIPVIIQFSQGYTTSIGLPYKTDLPGNPNNNSFTLLVIVASIVLGITLYLHRRRIKI